MNVQVVSASHCLEVDIEIEYLKNFMLARVMLNLGGIDLSKIFQSKDHDEMWWNSFHLKVSKLLYQICLTFFTCIQHRSHCIPTMSNYLILKYIFTYTCITVIIKYTCIYHITFIHCCTESTTYCKVNKII